MGKERTNGSCAGDPRSCPWDSRGVAAGNIRNPYLCPDNTRRVGRGFHCNFGPIHFHISFWAACCFDSTDHIPLVSNKPKNQILVWDPVTGDQHRLVVPPGVAAHAEKTVINGAVLRARAAGDDAQHFQVVLAVADNDDEQHHRALACVYSSETGTWGDLVSTQLPPDVLTSDAPTLVSTDKPAVLVGDSLYWKLAGNMDGILEFDLEKQSLAVIQVPVHILEEGQYMFLIMRAEGGGLGLLTQTDCSIQLWKMNTDCDGVASWGLGRTIELDKLLSLNSEETDMLIPGLEEENNVVFVWTDHIVFMVQLESMKFKKLSGTYPLSHYHPFRSVYAAGKACLQIFIVTKPI
ncbi:uncharacterized protein LOC125516511 [Triticum urartu]|uniref:uncharacterized protein LOC125516511 n=1 Tax=Triticum urartu TaxID=4572 RepID=UPI0020440105|nr:uncharacterized protein LOC125516511 [Triticum urartu]